MGKLHKTIKKVRDPGVTYRNKIKKITNWYNKLVKNHQEKDGLGRPKKELKPLSFFTDKVVKPK
jgi:hypothetical protein